MPKLSRHASDFDEGDALGEYTLEDMIGEGGMARVFRARRESDGSVVALKLLKVDLTGNDVYRDRFRHEARSAARVRHQNLVAIVDSGELDGRPYIASTFVEGETLERRVEETGPLPMGDVVELASEVAGGLDALHGAGLIHRDVKASNILLDGAGRAMLTDFGLARGPRYTVLTRPGQVLGTLEYMAPELIRGEPATPESDVYALACTVYEALTGRTPFAGGSVLRIGAAHLEETPPDPAASRPECGAALARAVLLPLAKDPRHRPLPATAYARALRAATVDD